MVFNSFTFILLFGLVLILHYSSLSWKVKKINLLIASYVFYAASNPAFILLLMICTVTDWFASRGIANSESAVLRRFFLVAALIVDLGMLGIFKYANFFLTNCIWLLSLFHIKYQPVKMNVILPLGISFFTFQSLTYTFDIYKRKAVPWSSFLDFALFVSFFPKLVIGPITRAFDFLPQCKNPVKLDEKKIFVGAFLFLLGLFEKIVLSDSMLAPVADQLFDKSIAPTMINAWAGSLAYTGQIFFDFAGYSNCAIGVAMCLGFMLPENFKYPYAAVGFTDFWRRWHISLSSWLRDYLYIPLGGNKKGRIRTYINLMLTMLLGGLWHGASWTFVVWGGLHGLYLVIERFLKNNVPQLSIWSKQTTQILFACITFVAVSIAWIFFRAESFGQAFGIIKNMVVLNHLSLRVGTEYFYFLMTVGVMLIIFISHWFMRDRSLEGIIDRMRWWQRSVIIAGMIIITITCSGDDRAFIYFQF